jgi:hypothetical protein
MDSIDVNEESATPLSVATGTCDTCQQPQDGLYAAADVSGVARQVVEAVHALNSRDIYADIPAAVALISVRRISPSKMHVHDRRLTPKWRKTVSESHGVAGFGNFCTATISLSVALSLNLLCVNVFLFLVNRSLRSWCRNGGRPHLWSRCVHPRIAVESCMAVLTIYATHTCSLSLYDFSNRTDNLVIQWPRRDLVWNSSLTEFKPADFRVVAGEGLGKGEAAEQSERNGKVHREEFSHF